MKRETEREEREKGKEEKGDGRNCHDFVVTRAAYARTFMGGFGRGKWRRKRGEGGMELGAGPGYHASDRKRKRIRSVCVQKLFI